jgi:hypothetical protein
MKVKSSFQWLRHSIEVPAGTPVELREGSFLVKSEIFSDISVRYDAWKNGCRVESDNITF